MTVPRAGMPKARRTSTLALRASRRPIPDDRSRAPRRAVRGATHLIAEVLMRTRLLSLALPFMGMAILAQPGGVQAQDVTIRGARILTMEGPPIENGTILVRDGKIRAVGQDLQIPVGIPVVDARGLTAMPGIIDAEGRAPGHGIRGLEGPMRAELIAGDFFDPYGRDYRTERTLEDLAEWGVTSMNVKLTDSNVFDGVSSVVKLYAPATYEEHFLKYRAALRINLGESARSDEGRFPTTRMGVVAMVRENFIKAQDYREKWDEYEADEDPEKTPPAMNHGMEHLAAALRGEIPVMMHAVEPMDVEAALRIGQEFDLRLILSASSMIPEALVPALKERDVPVILGTYFASINNHIGEQYGFRYETAALLAENDVPVAFGGLNGETKFLSLNAGIAVQNGMPHQKALEGLTVVPARMLGVEDRVGSLAEGKDADIVLYEGDPLEITTPVRMVFIGGRKVYEREAFHPAYSTMGEGGGS